MKLSSPRTSRSRLRDRPRSSPVGHRRPRGRGEHRDLAGRVLRQFGVARRRRDHLGRRLICQYLVPVDQPHTEPEFECSRRPGRRRLRRKGRDSLCRMVAGRSGASVHRRRRPRRGDRGAAAYRRRLPRGSTGQPGGAGPAHRTRGARDGDDRLGHRAGRCRSLPDRGGTGPHRRAHGRHHHVADRLRGLGIRKRTPSGATWPSPGFKATGNCQLVFWRTTGH